MRFPVCSRSGKHYTMMACHINTYTILVEPFQSKHNIHCLAAYDHIMTRLKKRRHTVDLKILDGEASQTCRSSIEDKWVCKLKLFPPYAHRHNATKCVIRTFKAHFLSILSGISDSFPNFLWDQLLTRTKITLNILKQCTIDPTMFALDSYHGTFNFDAAPMGPIGRPVIIHNKSGKHKQWDFRGCKGFSIGPALNHYQCFHLSRKPI